MPLSPRRSRFVTEYLVGLNATQAAIRAGYSPRTAKQQGSRLLTHVDVIAAMEARQEDLADENTVTPERVVAELARIAFARYGTYAKLEGDELILTDTDDLPDGADAAISEITQVTTVTGKRTVRVKLHNKIDALDKLGRVLGLFVDRLHVTGQVERPLRHFTVDELTKMLEAVDQDESSKALIEGEAHEVDP